MDSYASRASIPSDSQFVKSHGGKNYKIDTYDTKLL